MSESSKSPTKVRHFCNLCTKNYAYSSGLRRHMLTVHENVQPDEFKCQKCQRKFRSAHSIGLHRVTCFKSLKRDRHEILWSQQQQIERMNIELERLQTELRTTMILKNNLELKFDRMQKEVIQVQTKVYTTSKNHEKITDYINWLGM